METKLVIVILAVFLGLLLQHAAADFYFNRPYPNPKDNPELKLICTPGRTVVRIEESIKGIQSDEFASDEFMKRRSEPERSSAAAEKCRVCVCSVDGLNEYCSKRPVTSLNECLIMESINKRLKSGVPFEHVDNLAYRIRRDLIWHNDEIPYDPDARCFRGHSYYTNHITPNETDLNFDKGFSSLLDYRSRRSCHFCVCSVDGGGVSCIRRQSWFCDYFRYLRDENSPKKMYAKLCQQDRPGYFRQLSWRLRRTMDYSMFDLIANVGGDDYQSRQKSGQICIPFVSEYTDCSYENKCNPGCTKCTCSAKGMWTCQSVREDNCEHVSRPEQLDEMDIDDNLFDAAIDNLEYELNPKKRVSSSSYVPEPSVKSDEPAYLLDLVGRYDEIENLKELTRDRRSLKKTTKNIHTINSKEDLSKNKARKPRSYNNTVKFYSTVEELNEDTLKNSNHSGTLEAKRMELNLPVALRRSDPVENNNYSVRIDLNEPKMYNHIIDNKIDVNDKDHKFAFNHEHLKDIFANQTTKSKDKELSKLVVNELKKGTEIIGDVKAPATSNITFTSENDTLTAMAFIAGNLLNKLWNMEKDASGSSIETEDMKREKISDLLELFKEPLNLRQEDFLKRALEELSNAIDKDKDVKNISLCQTIEEASKLLDNTGDNEEKTSTVSTRKHELCKNSTKNSEKQDNQEKATIHAISKINNVLSLMKKFEKVQKKIGDLKSEPNDNKQENITVTESFVDGAITKDESNTFNVFGNVLDKITKLMMPHKNGKKTSNLIKSKSSLNNDKAFRETVKKMCGIDLANMTITAKDKLIFEYIKHINSNPDCVLNKNRQRADLKSLPNIEGNILLNLSEFFKMKSFADLIHLIKPEISTANPTTIGVLKKTILRVETTTATQNTDKDLTNEDKFASTKQKLKAHLKTIIEDLIELQNASGISPQRNIRIADALPCIYKIMNAGKEVLSKNSTEKDKADGIVEMFKDLKNTMKTAQTRTSDPILRIRPKSAVVLERVVKNLQPKVISNSRRAFHPKEGSLDDIKKIISNIRNMSSSFKSQALLDDVPAAEKIVLVKALERDVNMYIRALEEIKRVFENRQKLSPQQHKEISEFILNSAKNITLSQTVVKKIEKVVPKKTFDNDMEKTFNNILNTQPQSKFNVAENLDDNVRISRNQIISQLIRNRVQIYMKLKEAKVLNVQNDMHYNIAKRILFYLDGGNYSLANELFKVLVMEKEDNLDNAAHDPGLNYPVSRGQVFQSKNAVTQMQPMNQFQNPNYIRNQIKLIDQDHLIKQLLNIKNMPI